MKVLSVADPVWADAANTCINCMVQFDTAGMFGPQLEMFAAPIHFTAHPDDVVDYGVAIFNQAKAMGPAAYIAPAPVVPASISDLQFAMQARNQGFITQAEAVAFVSNGTIPAAMVAIINTLPTQQQKDDATLTVSGTKVFLRNDPLTITIGSAFAASTGATNATAFMDAFFIAAAALI